MDSPLLETNPFEKFETLGDVEYFLRCLARVSNLNYKLCEDCEKAADCLREVMTNISNC